MAHQFAAIPVYDVVELRRAYENLDTTLSDALRRSQRPNGYASYSSMRPSCRAILAES